MSEAKLKLLGTNVFDRTEASRKPIVVNVGGARSSKSYSIAQLFVIRFMREHGKKFIVTRKTNPALKITAYKVITDLLKEIGAWPFVKHNGTSQTMEFNGNFMLFTSIDDPEKIKSTEWNYVWMEEANEFTWDDFVMLDTRMSAPNPDGINQIFLSLNPSDEMGWIHQRLEPQVERVDTIYSSFLDNPFLSESYINEKLLALKDQDETFYKIYALGQWATPQNVIYTHWDIVESLPDGETIHGLDFGFNNPTALVRVVFYDGECYLSEELFESRLTNAELIARMEGISSEIYADCAEPNRIEEISRAGFNIHPANKDVSKGIDTVKSMKLHVLSSSVNLLAEIRGYKWKEDRNGNVMDEPVKWNDHLMDALRYAIHTHTIAFQPSLRYL